MYLTPTSIKNYENERSIYLKSMYDKLFAGLENILLFISISWFSSASNIMSFGRLLNAPSVIWDTSVLMNLSVVNSGKYGKGLSMEPRDNLRM